MQPQNKAFAHIAIEAAARAYHRADKEDQPSLWKEYLVARSTLQTTLTLRKERVENDAIRLRLLRNAWYYQGKPKLSAVERRTFRVFGV